MSVQAENPVGGGHHHVQVMGDQENAAMQFVANAADQVIKRDLAGKVDALDRLVEHKQVGLPGNGTGQKDTLEFAARQGPDLRAGKMGDTGPGHGRCRLLFRHRSGQVHEAAHGERQCPVDRQFLRDIGHAKPGIALHTALVRPDDAERHAGCRRFSRTVRTDQRDDLAAAYGERNAPDEPSAAAIDTGIVERYERVWLLEHRGHLAGVRKKVAALLPAHMAHVISLRKPVM